LLLGTDLFAYRCRGARALDCRELRHSGCGFVVEFSPNLPRASEQMRSVLTRPEMETVCALDFTIEDGSFETTEYGVRRLVVMRPSGSIRDAQNAAIHA